MLGPPLWNTFFSDVSAAARHTGGKEQMFADDLNIFREFPQATTLTDCQSDLQRYRERVHNWGKANRVSFDASKEHMVVLHPSKCHGEAFKLLGCMMDTDLRMHSCIDQILAKIRPKVTASLRTRGYYKTADLILQFKTHVWGLIEGNMGAYFHTASSLLQKIDAVQERFLRELGLTPAQGFLEFNFAPPSLRRHIGILGLLQKRILGLCHPSFDILLPWWSTRFSEPRGIGHSKQLYGHWVEITNHQMLFNRSIFSMVDVYNNLPQSLVDSPSVKVFHSGLTQIARERCQRGDPLWASSFNINGDV